MKVLRVIGILLILLGLFIWVGQALAQTYVSGSIDQNTPWTEANSPYIVTGDVTVLEGVTLTIEPGVVVKFSYTRLKVEGTLVADGTSGQPIVFTSFKDDSVGGDTNGDGNATSLAKGDSN